MKKILLSALALVFCFASLSACSKKNEATATLTTKGNPKSSIETVKASADEVVAVAELKKLDNGFNLKGYINKKGKWVIAPQYEEAYPFVDNVATVMTKDDIWKLIDKSNKTIAEFEKGIEVYTLRDKDISEFQSFHNINTISEGRIIIKKDDLYGVADTKGKIIVEPQYDSLGMYSNGMATVELNTGKPGLQCGYLDLDGNVAISGVGYAHFFRDGLAFVQCDVYSEKYGYGGFINKQGEMIIPMDSTRIVSSHITNFFKGVAVTIINGNSGTYALIDKSGNVVKTLGQLSSYPAYSAYRMEFGDGMCPIYFLDKGTGTFSVGFINTKGETVIAPQTEWGLYDSTFSEGYCKVGAGGKYGYINKSGKVVVPLKYSNAHPFTYGLAAVETDNDTWKYIDAEGKTVISITDMTDAMPFSK